MRYRVWNIRTNEYKDFVTKGAADRYIAKCIGYDYGLQNKLYITLVAAC